jgi:hypothetical protein
MVIVRLWGGLGNQLFQYAAGKALALKHDCALKIDPSLLFENLEDPLTVKREMDLEVFQIPIKLATQKEISRFNPKPSNLAERIYHGLRNRIEKPNVFFEKHFHYQADFEEIQPPVCLVGNFQSPCYFDRVWSSFYTDFTFRKPTLQTSKKLAKSISHTSSVCINVRRSDYVNHPIYSKTLGFRGLEYLIPAIETIKLKVLNPHFFIFSDDMEWCRTELLPISGGTLVDHSHKGWKFGNYLHLMTLCKHHIIPNSTFGWWAAWLGKKPGQIVIAPKIWYQDTSFDTKDLCPIEWIRL